MPIVDLGDFDAVYENNGFNSYFTTCYSVRTVLDRRFNRARFFPPKRVFHLSAIFVNTMDPVAALYRSLEFGRRSLCMRRMIHLFPCLNNLQ